ncbi:MAG: helicase-related protein [Pseudomonadota bacterium]
MTELKAVLGPTNTGKTHYAVERMLAHGTGMIGLPLRLLARELYDRIVAQKGEAACALITGEERIEPPGARYFVCTVEAMPVHKRVDFLAIDEIQIAEDEDRGHIFTDRLLNARGTQETVLLGADTMRPMLRELGLKVETDTRERFSELKYAGPSKLTRLPKRTAIVAFSSDAVYATAEILRRQKGGAVVVMGALSPRTRNAQVELFQSGEVDFLVATDAIGMGLNLDVERIAFAERSKFDGRRHRVLSAAECGQIAGRAGRFRSDGEFGEVGDCAAFDEEMVRRIEDHRFEPVTDIQWRNSELDFRSIKTLIASLARPSPLPVLRQNPHALDEWVLRRMAEDAEIGPDVRGQRVVRRLWDLARLPDFRKAGHDGHGRLVLGLAETLHDPDARLGDAAMGLRLDNLSSTQGDIAQLQTRLAAIRTWAYAAHRDDWLENPVQWREKTREIEDKLSDALHQALTARFVDKRTTALLAGMKREHGLVGEMNDDGEVSVEGHVVGKLTGLTFEPASQARSLEGKAVRNAAQQAMRPILTDRLKRIAGHDGLGLAFAEDGTITFLTEPVATLAKGADWLSPRVELAGGEGADNAEREAALARLEAWVQDQIKKRLPTHYALKVAESAKSVEGLARGLAFRVMDSGAAVDLRGDDPSHRLKPEERAGLKLIGLRAGRVAAYAGDAQKPAAQKLTAVLRSTFDGAPCPTAPDGAGSFAIADERWTDAALNANGYLRFGKRAVRADLAERLGWEISKKRREAEKNAFPIPADMASIVSCPADAFGDVLKGFGLAPAEKDAETGVPTLWKYAARARPDGDRPRGRRPRREGDTGGSGAGGRGQRRDGPGGKAAGGSGPRQGGARRTPDPDSPFAALAVLVQKPDPKAGKPKRKRKRGKGKGAGAVGSPVSAGSADFSYTPFQ